MSAGHFGVAGIVKAWRPGIPMAALLVATRSPDLVFVPPALAGVERVEPAEPKPNGYGSALITAEYSHSPLSNVPLALIVGALVHAFLFDLWG